MNSRASKVIAPFAVDDIVKRYGFVCENEDVRTALVAHANGGEIPNLASNDVKYIIDQLEQLNQTAYYDKSNTGLFNRNAFDREIETIVKPRLNSENNEPPVTVAIIDLNYLKPLNDFSYPFAGDVALKYVADYVSTALRKESPDKNNVDTLFRYGGDEFAVIMRGCDKEQAEKRLDKILKDMAKDSLHGDNKCLGGINKDITLQTSAAFGCAEVKANYKDQNLHDVIKEIIDTANDGETKNKEYSKKYASNIEGGIPYTLSRSVAEKLVPEYLQAKVNGNTDWSAKKAMDKIIEKLSEQGRKGDRRHSEPTIKETIAEIAKSHNRHWTSDERVTKVKGSWHERLQEQQNSSRSNLSR